MRLGGNRKRRSNSTFGSALIALCSLFAWPTIGWSSTCADSDIIIGTAFASAKVSKCEIDDDNKLIVYTEPENTPINSSPWYAFDISTNSEPRAVEVVIQPTQGDSRYLPKMSRNNRDWHVLPFALEEGAIKLQLTVEKDPIRIAAQPIIDEVEYDRRLFSAPDVLKRFSLVQVGKSAQGRPIKGLLANHADNTEWLVLIGRQHPPEITGAEGMIAFIQHLSTKSKSNDAFFSRFNVFAVPLMNPDGVVAGNWRHNHNGADLNRDWGHFTQPETKSVNTFVQTLLGSSQRLVFALDFHSTQQDIFYTMPTDYGLFPSDFSARWLADLKNKTIRSFTVRERAGSSPGRGVFKQFIADNYGVHAVTVEFGDNTPFELVRHVAISSADSLVQQMLTEPQQNFIGPSKKYVAAGG